MVLPTSSATAGWCMYQSNRNIYHFIMNTYNYSMIFLLLLFSGASHASEPLRVSLILGDSATRQAIEITQSLKQKYPQLVNAEFKVYSVSRIKDQNHDHVRKSDLVMMLFMGRDAINSVREALVDTIKGGGKVYGFGPSFGEQDEEIGIIREPELWRYYDNGGAENIGNGLLFGLSKIGVPVAFGPPQMVPKTGLYSAETKRIYEDYETFAGSYSNKPGDQSWVGLLVYRDDVVSGDTQYVDAMIAALEKRGLNVMTAYGYPNEKPIEDYFFGPDGKARVAAIVASTLKIGINPDAVLPVLERLGVPVFNAVTPYAMSRAEWEASPIGLDVMERTWQLFLPEMVGAIQPTIVATKELIQDAQSGVAYMMQKPIQERVDMLSRRVQRWVDLRNKPNQEKKIFLCYYNYPPGKDGIGASYLNVVPESLWQVMKRLEKEGYDLTGMPKDKETLQYEVTYHGSNIANWNHDEIDKLVREAKPVLLPIETYKKWLAKLPKPSQDAIIKSWGKPEVNNMMAYIDEQGKRYIVLPVLRYGNVLLGPQPSKGWTENPDKLFHDLNFPPSHQYVGFYLWLHNEFKADAMMQFGTHGTIEWLPGKEAGLSGENPPEYLVQDIPFLYAYIVDDPGEGLQAKRRGNAVMIDHMTPPFDKAQLNPELRELRSMLDDYDTAKEKNPALAESRLAAINEMGERMGLFKDLGMTKLGVRQIKEFGTRGQSLLASAMSSEDPTEDAIHGLRHYLEEIAEKLTPFGMHTLGVAPKEKMIKTTAEAVVSRELELDKEQRERRIKEIKDLIHQSARDELDAVIAGLSGRFITVGPGGDPVRNPRVLPTGRNFYAFDPRRIPAKDTYALGVKLANDLIETYKANHGEYPDKLSFNLWGLESIRHEGVSESQIMHLMGVRPVWNSRGVVSGVEPIPRAELNRSRIDVTVVASGLYRDLFSNLMLLLDQAVSVAQAQEEADNSVRNNKVKTQAMLEQRGVAPDLAARMAGVRLFSQPSGVYGTNISDLSDRSDTWDSEKQVSDVYFKRIGHMYGQGFWSDNGDSSGVAGLGIDVLKNALSGSKIAVHSKSSNVYQTLDNDDFFQYLGGTAMAIRAVDGASPEVYVTNLSNPAEAAQETLDKFMGREMRTRYTNPAWIKSMQDEGYAGAKFINEVVQNLWGWQVTVPEAVDAAKWNEMYETYVKDRYDLDMEQFFRDAGNLWAMQDLMARMLEAVRKGYWKPEDAVVQDLGTRVSELIEELKLKCTEDDCHDPILTKLVQAKLVPVPAAVAITQAPAAATAKPAASAPPSSASAPSAQPQTQQVEGYKMEQVSKSFAPAMEPVTPWMQILGFLALCLTLWWGFRRAYHWAYRLR